MRTWREVRNYLTQKFRNSEISGTSALPVSAERIGNFCNPNPIQCFHCVIQSDPNPTVNTIQIFHPIRFMRE